MTLSALIHKRKSKVVATLTVATIATQDTDSPPRVSKVASLAAVSKSDALVVVCYTPAGNPIAVQACNAEHAEWLRRVNPAPASPTKVAKFVDDVNA
ncbi:MAG TPA: hypothetical protein DCZ48_12490 [Methylococcaceae bacterium]|nr:hypothetical protein [Methylococcaceae bacterium]